MLVGHQLRAGGFHISGNAAVSKKPAAYDIDIQFNRGCVIPWTMAEPDLHGP